jgi:hypothetical protein
MTTCGPHHRAVSSALVSDPVCSTARRRGPRFAGGPPRRGLRRLWGLVAVIFPLVLPSGTALADDPWESWPEASAFVGLNPSSRLYLDAAYAQGKESANQALDVAAYYDFSLKPILRPKLLQEDWARRRYLWARVGYDHVFKGEGGEVVPPENRGILSIYGRVPLPVDVWLETRVRSDLRWMEGNYSTRYRLRGELTREFTLRQHPVTPYLNVEWFYDMRHDGLSRVLFMGGSEFTVDSGFRFELYLARQEDHQPAESALNAFGMVAKWYF